MQAARISNRQVGLLFCSQDGLTLYWHHHHRLKNWFSFKSQPSFEYFLVTPGLQKQEQSHCILMRNLLDLYFESKNLYSRQPHEGCTGHLSRAYILVDRKTLLKKYELIGLRMKLNDCYKTSLETDDHSFNCKDSTAEQ